VIITSDWVPDLGPLDDPDFEPQHPPVAGRPPAVVERWGARSQVRWFRRFADQVRMPARDYEPYHVWSLLHRGLCCVSCSDDVMEGLTDIVDGSRCCCLGIRLDGAP
jgi:hypothetical protein